MRCRERPVVLMVTSKSLGGSATYIQHLVEGLSDRFDFVTVYGTGNPQDARLEAMPGGCLHFPMRVSMNPRSILDATRWLVSVIRRLDPDIVHTNTSLGGLVGRLAARACGRSSSVVHTLHAFGADQYTPQPGKSLYWLVERVLDRWTGLYICVSEFMRIYGTKSGILSRRNQVVIHNTIGSYDDSGADVRRAKIRAELGIASDEVLAVFVGRLERQKGITFLVDALAQSRAANLKVALCGIGGLESELRRKVERKGLADRMIFLGWRDDVADWIGGCDFMVLPSLWESFGLVNLEAMAFAKAVCATCTQGVPEVVENGVTGLLVPPGDSAALAESLDLLAGRPELCASLGEAGRRRFRRHFSYCVHLERTAAAYGVLLDRKRCGR